MPFKRDTLLNLLIAVLALIPIVLQLYRAGDVSTLVIIGILSIVVLVGIGLDWVRFKLGRIEIITTRLNKLEERMDYMKELNTLDKRLSILERKGAADPKVVTLIIVIVLVILYLRTAGFI